MRDDCGKMSRVTLANCILISLLTITTTTTLHTLILGGIFETGEYLDFNHCPEQLNALEGSGHQLNVIQIILIEAHHFAVREVNDKLAEWNLTFKTDVKTSCNNPNVGVRNAVEVTPLNNQPMYDWLELGGEGGQQEFPVGSTLAGGTGLRTWGSQWILWLPPPPESSQHTWAK